MKKSELFSVFYIFMLSLLSLGMLSCEKEKEDEYVSDPEGTIEIDMRKKGEGSTYVFLNNVGAFYINKSDNFDGSYVSFADVGSVKGLSYIKSIPQSGWATEVAVRPGHGYVITDGGVYMRLYVEKYIKAAETGGVIGAQVKYQRPWNP